MIQLQAYNRTLKYSKGTICYFYFKQKISAQLTFFFFQGKSFPHAGKIVKFKKRVTIINVSWTPKNQQENA